MSADFPDRLTLYSVGRQYLLQRATGLAPGIVDVEGSDANVFVGSMSFIGEAVVQQEADRYAALTLDGAFGEDLDRYAWDRYRLLREGAVASVGTARFFRTSLSAGLGAVDIGQKLTSLTGIEYVTTQVVTFGASSFEGFGDVRSTLAGQNQNLGRNQLRNIVNPGALWDPSLQVTNPDPTAHGADRESDADFKIRIRGFWLAARRGTLSAISFGALQVPGIASADAQEVLSPGATPARVVQLYIADGSGVASRSIAAVVDATLLEWRAGGIFVEVNTSTPQIVSVQMHLAFVAGVETATLAETIRASVLGYVNSLNVNEPLYRGNLSAVFTRFAGSGLIPNESTVNDPAGDLVPEPGKTIRTTLDRVTIV
jgi:hypothetical protein